MKNKWNNFLIEKQSFFLFLCVCKFEKVQISTKCTCATEQPRRATIYTMLTILNQETNYCIVDGEQTDGPAAAASIGGSSNSNSSNSGNDTDAPNSKQKSKIIVYVWYELPLHRAVAICCARSRGMISHFIHRSSEATTSKRQRVWADQARPPPAKKMEKKISRTQHIHTPHHIFGSSTASKYQK